MFSDCTRGFSAGAGKTEAERLETQPVYCNQIPRGYSEGW